jgi:sensor histidine kinase YesM
MRVVLSRVTILLSDPNLFLYSTYFYLLLTFSMKKFCLLLCFLQLASDAFSSDTLRVSQVRDFIGIGTEQIGEIKKGNGRAALLTFVLENDLSRAVFIDLNIPSSDSIIAQIQRVSNDSLVITGPYVSANRWPFPEDPGIVPVSLEPGEAVGLKVRIWSETGRPFSIGNIVLQNREYTLEQSMAGFRDFMGRTEFNGFFLGAMVFAMLFFLLIWAKVGQRVFLLYSLYLLGAVVYSLIVKTLPYSYLAKLAYLNYPLTYKLGEPVQYLFFAAYMAFAKDLLDIGPTQRLLNNIIRIFTYSLLAGGLGLLLYNFLHFDYSFQRQAFIVSRLFILPVAFALLFWIIFKVDSPVKWFFVTGSSFFFLGGLLAVIVDPKSRHLFFGITSLNPVNFFKTGILLECLCFALALGYKIRMQQRDRDQAARAYIAQLELNRQMAETENQRLEKMVDERTSEILERNRQIEAQKQAQLRADLEKQLAEMEMKALRSQMNPHFIFNSLNSIRYQILKQDYDIAVDYLNHFSKLLRYVLQNSREHVVSLADEIEMNRLYVELEKLRFSQGFEFLLSIPDEVDAGGIMVPPMLLQPYIENAVKHGLVPSRKALKRISLKMQTYSSGYYIVIEDNGVGRGLAPKSALLGKQQLGMVIASERIELFNQHFRPRIRVEVEDLFEASAPSGTRVLFTYDIQENDLLSSSD